MPCSFRKFRINDRPLNVELPDVPADGSFAEFVVTFDPALLQEGTNVLEIRTTSCPENPDDFEFINVRFRLSP